MPGLLSLANELIEKIANELDTRKTFRGTCRHINAVVFPRVFSYITIDIQEELLDVGISQLEALATKSTCVAEYVRTVEIRRLAPSYNPSFMRGYKFVNGKPIRIRNPNRAKVEWAEDKMRELLPKALTMLRGATTVVWGGMCSRNPDWASILISEFLGTIPALHTLHLGTIPILTNPHLVESLGRSKLHLDRVMNLTELSVKDDLDAAIAEIIGNSPHLTRLELDFQVSMYKAAGYTETFHELLRKVPRGRPLHLEHLTVSGYCIRLDHETLPHLRHLRSLEVGSIRVPVNERWNYPAEHLSKSDRFGSSSGDLWGVIRREGIPIEVVAAPADDAVVEYLALASGIKKISLLHPDCDVLANKFFTQVVPRHSNTLVSLSIPASFEGQWCFGQYNMSILLECTQLAELTIAVDSSGASGRKQAALCDNVNQIMSMAAQMPNLWRLELLSANRQDLRDVGSGNPTILHHQRITRALRESITSFGPVDPAIHPNQVWVDRKKFRPQRGVDGVVKYV